MLGGTAFITQGYGPLRCDRVLHGNRSIPVTFVAFDVLRIDGHDVMCNPWAERRALLEQLGLQRSCVRLSDVFDDGQLLFDAVVESGLEGVVAKKRNGIYRPGYRGWTKVKNQSYWRRDQEIESLRRSARRSSAVAGFS